MNLVDTGGVEVASSFPTCLASPLSSAEAEVEASLLLLTLLLDLVDMIVQCTVLVPGLTQSQRPFQVTEPINKMLFSY